MKKALSLPLLLGMIVTVLQGGVAAEAFSSASSTNSAPQSVTSASFVLTAVNDPSNANSGKSLALSVSSRRGFFFLKNFGSTALTGFSMTQTRSTSTVRYCVGQVFRTGNATTCLDGTAAILIGTGTSLPNRTFTVPLAPGLSYAFSSSFTSGSTNTVSVSVSRSNITSTTTSS
jgi:hypothetical protein